MLRIILLLVAVAAALPAAAGPWPRERGEGFVSFSASRDRHEVYGEAGLGRGWTASAKLAFSHRPQADRAEEALVHLWRQVRQGDGGSSLSLGIGAGVRSIAPGRAAQPVGALSVAWGRGFGGPMAPWVTAEATVEGGRPGRAAKIDLTLGVKPGERWLAMAQVQHWHPASGPSRSRLELTGGLRVGELTFLAQPSVGLGGQGDRRLRFSLWSRF